MYRKAMTLQHNLSVMVRWTEDMAALAESMQSQEAADVIWEAVFALRRVEQCLGKDGRMRRRPSSAVRI